MLNDYWYVPFVKLPGYTTSVTTVFEFRLDWRVERELGRRAMRRGRLLALEIECAIREQSF